MARFAQFVGLMVLAVSVWAQGVATFEVDDTCASSDPRVCEALFSQSQVETLATALATMMQAQAYTAYDLNAFGYDHETKTLSWTLSTRITNEAGETLKTGQKEAKYTLSLETGEIISPRTTGFVDLDMHRSIWEELLHMRALLVHVSDILSESAEDDLRASK